jgi:single-strand DNA-binding protein
MSQSLQSLNFVVVAGRLSRAPEVRTLPSGDVLVAYEVTVPRTEGPADSVPVVWFPTARRQPSLDEGDEVVVVGRVRRRFFRSGGTTRSRTEVLADRVVPARARSRATTMVDDAVATLLGGG